MSPNKKKLNQNKGLMLFPSSFRDADTVLALEGISPAGRELLLLVALGEKREPSFAVLGEGLRRSPKVV